MSTRPTRNQTGRNNINDKAPHLLLRAPNFVSGPEGSEASPAPLTCEASALTTELTALKRIYFSPKSQLCKHLPLRLCGNAAFG